MADVVGLYDAQSFAAGYRMGVFISKLNTGLL